MISAEKSKALQNALNQIEKQYGKGSVMKLGDYNIKPIDHIPTGSLSFGRCFRNRWCSPWKNSRNLWTRIIRKTTLALHIIANAQKNGGVAAFIDAEHSLDPIYASALGVNINELIISQPDNGESAMEITETLVRSGAVDVVVVDSVAALVPQKELEGEMGDSFVGLQARLMSQALRKLAGAINKSNTVAVFINQLREKVGVMFGNPETTTGGRALKFYASVRMDVRRIESIKQGSNFIGNRTKVKIVKNKVAPPFKEAEFDIMYGSGISKEGDILDLAIDNGIVDKAGAWISYNDMRIGQGRENAKQYLRENPEVLEKIENEVMEKLLPHSDTKPTENVIETE